MSFNATRLIRRDRRDLVVSIGNLTACAMSAKRKPCGPPVTTIACMPLCAHHQRVLDRIIERDARGRTAVDTDATPARPARARKAA